MHEILVEGVFDVGRGIGYVIEPLQIRVIVGEKQCIAGHSSFAIQVILPQGRVLRLYKQRGKDGVLPPD